jgi:hypothetical protein
MSNPFAGMSCRHPYRPHQGMQRAHQGCVKPAGERVLGLDESPKSDGPKSETSPKSELRVGHR